LSCVHDPICGMEVDNRLAFVHRHAGRMHFFCCPECKKRFE